MYKIFTDADKWDKKWFRKIEPKYKCFWLYILDKSSRAGVWEVDFESVNFFINDKIDINKVKEIFSSRITELRNGKKWFIKNYVLFQYGRLTENNNMHIGIIQELKRYGIKLKDGIITSSKEKSEKPSAKKDKTVGDNAMEYLINIPDDDIKVFKEKFKISEKVIREQGERARDWCMSSGKRKKDYNAFLRNWIRNSIDWGEKGDCISDDKQKYKGIAKKV